MTSRTCRIVLCALAVCLLPNADLRGQDELYGPVLERDNSASAFTMTARKLPFKLNLMSIFVLPRETVDLEVVADFAGRRFKALATGGSIETITPIHWRWTAPDTTGVCSLAVTSLPEADTTTIQMVVMVPFDSARSGFLNGYRIGKYPHIPYKNLPIYKPPKGFIEVTPGNQDIYLTPHFKLSQFVCKQPGDFPRYVVLREELLLKLEVILASVNERGYLCRTFEIISGYRTPWYNRSIGNVKYSRHLWGGAADIYIDENPRDGMMDDLNKDGRINWKDAAILYDVIDDMYGKKFYDRFIGGLARYRKTNRHGPFVHVDVRGFRARWGD